MLGLFFLGLLNFYNRFIPHLAQHNSEFTALLYKSAPTKIAWTPELNETFH